MAEDDLLDVLDFMGFANLFTIFEDNNITKEGLSSLSVDKIKEIVPEHQVEKFIEKCTEYFDKSVHEILNTSQTSAERPSNVFTIENVDVEKILKNSFEGNQILVWKKNNEQLNPRMRTRLVHFVIADTLTKCKSDLKDNDFKILTSKIVQLFPKECPLVYYAPRIPKHKSTTEIPQKTGGKLVHKYFNLKRLPAEVYKSKKDSHGEVLLNNEILDESSDQLKESIEWLNTQEEPWEITEQHWKKTADFRRSKIGNGFNNKVSTAYQEWPILKVPKGYALINIDFYLDKFTKQENCILNFENFFLKASEARPRRKDEYCDMLKSLLQNGNLNNNAKTLVQLTLLCYMLPSTARIPQGNKKYWKPSCAESLDGIIAHAKIYGDIDKIKADRHVYAISKKITVQPYVIFVGENNYSVDSTYLCIDEVIYNIPTFLEALDLCFKSFHVFNAKYPLQSEHIWLMLQIGLYKFRTKWDKAICCVNEILNDMECYLEP